MFYICDVHVHGILSSLLLLLLPLMQLLVNMLKLRTMTSTEEMSVSMFCSKIIKSSSRYFMTSNSRKMHFHCNSDCIALSKKWIIVFCPFLDSFCCEGIEQWINKFVLAYLSFHPTVMKNNCTKACRLSIPVLCFEIWPLLLLLHAIIPQPSLALAGRITMQLDAMRWHLMYALLLHNSASASGRMISRVSFP